MNLVSVVGLRVISWHTYLLDPLPPFPFPDSLSFSPSTPPLFFICSLSAPLFSSLRTEYLLLSYYHRNLFYFSFPFLDLWQGHCLQPWTLSISSRVYVNFVASHYHGLHPLPDLLGASYRILTIHATQDDADPGSNRDKGSNSLSGFLSTLVPNLIIAGIFIALFLIFRPKFARVYAPRTYVNSLGDQYVSPHNQELLPHHPSTTNHAHGKFTDTFTDAGLPLPAKVSLVG